MKKQYLIFLLLLFNTLTSESPQIYNTQQIQQINNLLANQAKQNDRSDFDEFVFNWSGTFAEVLEKIKLGHYKITNPQDCMIKAIDAFLNCLDPHSNLLDPKAFKRINETTNGNFFGIGVVIDNTRKTKDKFLTIISVMPKGPAEKAGIQAYDKIIEIDGAPLKNMTTEEAMEKLKGERKTNVNVKILREEEKEPLDFTITRDVVKEANVIAFDVTDYNICYIAITQFSKSAAIEAKKEILKVNKKPYKGLILDLRNNSGGALDSAINIVDLFLEKDQIVVLRKNYQQNIITEKTKHEKTLTKNIPIFILINNYTASASEILAGSLQIHSINNNGPQVFLLGTKTFGKGSVQGVVPLSNNCAIKMTAELYFLPNDKTIQGEGITPDFIVEKLFPPPKQVAWYTKHYGREKALEHTIKPKEEEKADKKKNKKNEQDEEKPKSWSERIKKILEEDNQLREAIQMINTLEIAQKYHPESTKSRKSSIEYLSTIFPTGKTLTLTHIKG